MNIERATGILPILWCREAVKPALVSWGTKLSHLQSSCRSPNLGFSWKSHLSGSMKKKKMFSNWVGLTSLAILGGTRGTSHNKVMVIHPSLAFGHNFSNLNFSECERVVPIAGFIMSQRFGSCPYACYLIMHSVPCGACIPSYYFTFQIQ